MSSRGGRLLSGPRARGEEDVSPREVPVSTRAACPRRLAQVQAALRRRAADLRDSLVLSEFLQNLQEEEERSRQGAREVSSGDGSLLGSPSGWAQPEGWSEAGRGAAPLQPGRFGGCSTPPSRPAALLVSARERAPWLAGGFSPVLGPG